MEKVEIIVTAIVAIVEALVGISNILMWLADHNRGE